MLLQTAENVNMLELAGHHYKTAAAARLQGQQRVENTASELYTMPEKLLKIVVDKAQVVA